MSKVLVLDSNDLVDFLEAICFITTLELNVP
jgi:hypothetical protein